MTYFHMNGFAQTKGSSKMAYCLVTAGHCSIRVLALNIFGLLENELVGETYFPINSFSLKTPFDTETHGLFTRETYRDYIYMRVA